MRKSFFYDDTAVNVVIGSVLNLMVLMIITGTITGAFFIFTGSSAEQSMRAGFTDLGSEIARDITNIDISNSDFESNSILVIERPIPLTIGGSGYGIELRNAGINPDGLASVVIKETGFFGDEVSTTINSIDSSINLSGKTYSSSGIMNLTVIKNETGEWFRIK